MSDNNEWFIVKRVKTENTKFIAIIPKFEKEGTVYIDSGNIFVYCVNNDDNVYVYDCIDGAIINDVNKNFISQPKKVKHLSQKQVIDIKYGVNFAVALTKSGSVYSWGRNNYGQLGHADTDDEYSKPTLISYFDGESVVDIRCGSCHCVALTRNGEVFEWGRDSVSKERITIPLKVNGLKFYTIIAIACGMNHSIALTDNGEVFGWGRNSIGQLGIGSNSNTNKPIKIDNLNGDKIIKISCGSYHSMLLSENGDMYVFGANDCGQIGDESYANKNIPIKLDNSTKFVDIAGTGFFNNEISTGLSVDGFCYVWGRYSHRRLNKPNKTQFKNIDDLLMKCSTYKTYYFSKYYENMSPIERFKEKFNKQDFKFNDITFKIDGKFIYVQKAYLISVCEHFDTLFSNEWIESTNKEIEITQYSYSVYYAFLKYLYTNSVDIQSKDLIELYYLSDSYFEKNLKNKCIEIMEEVINVNNVINFYSFAIKNNFEELEECMYDYMKNRMTDILITKAYIEMNDNSITKRLFETVLKNGTSELIKL